MSFLSTLQVEYGTPFLKTLAVAYFGMRGISGSGVYSLALPYYQELLQSDIETYHRTVLFVTFIWAAKPLFGLLSDNLPLWGYKKRYYVVICSCLAGWSSIMLAASEPTFSNFWYFFFIVLGIAFTDLLFEAKYSELMNMSQTNISGANIISFAWGLGAFGSAIGSLWGSQMASNHQIRHAFVLIAIPPILLALRVFNQGMQEAKRVPKSSLKMPLVIIALWLIGSTLVSALAVTKLSSTHAVIVQLFCAGLLIHASLRWIPKLEGTETTMAQCNVFLFLAEITAIRLTGATDYFFTADCPSGAGVGGLDPTPQFTYDFYLGWMPIVASIAGLMGVYIFTVYLQHLPLRYVFQLIAIFRILISGLEVWQASRRNLGHIDDKLLFFISEGMISPVVSMTYLLPLVAITSRMMPKGNEALTYGILAGYQNFGQSIANSIGLMLIEKSDVGTNCDFTNYPFLVFCAHILAPLATIPLACFLVPTITISKSKKCKDSDVYTPDLNLESSNSEPRPMSTPPRISSEESAASSTSLLDEPTPLRPRPNSSPPAE